MTPGSCATPNSGSIFQAPVASTLEGAERILIAGAGGGFDVFAGLPLFLALSQAGKSLWLANLSFTFLGATSAPELEPGLFRVGPETSGPRGYFPEKYLAEWLAAQGHSSIVYSFEKRGVRPLRSAYQHIIVAHDIDTVILVDGGTDILMRGDEAGLGTPAEDMTSLAAVRGLEIPRKIVSCLGFGVDAFHGVCHAHFLENVAELSRLGGYLGTHSIHLSMPEVTAFRAAVAYAHERMPERPSIVNGSIISALEGRFGNVHSTLRTQSSELFINPLMSMYWHFALDTVAAHSLYLEFLEGTETMLDVQVRIDAFRNSVKTRRRRLIPV